MKEIRKIIGKESYRKFFTLEHILAESVLLLVVLFVGAFLRFYQIDTRPGFEWDEPVYAKIVENVQEYGFPSIQSEGNQGLQPYLYHPPYDFYLRSIWLDVTGINSIASARILSGLGSILLLLLIYYLFREITSRKIAFLSTLLIATDGWLIYTNRLNLIENIMMPIAVLAIAIYVHASQHERPLEFALAGVMLAFTAVYKHTGIYFLLIPIIYYWFTKKDKRGHKILYTFSFITIVLYLLSMYTAWGGLYIEQTTVQVRRALGIIDSRGLNYTILDALDALKNTYWIYFTTIASLLAGTILVFKNFVKFVISKTVPEQPLLLSWSLASLLFLFSISLKAPQYLVIALLPLYVYLAVEVVPYITYRKKHTVLYVFLSLMLIANAYTWIYRFVVHNDNALLSTYQYVNSEISSSAVILTEDSIGVGIKQAYYKLDLHNSQEELTKINPDYVITYLSATQRPPKSESLDNLIRNAELVTSYKGFKENILVYKIR